MDERKKEMIVLSSDNELSGKIDGSDYPQDVFCYILKDTPFQDYALWIFKGIFVAKHARGIIEKGEMYASWGKETLMENKCIAEALLACKKDDNWGIYSSKKKLQLNEKMRKKIENTLEEEYKKAGLNLEEMSFEEGKEALSSNKFGDAVEFVNKYMQEYADELGLNEEERCAGWSFDGVIDDDMVEAYIDQRKKEIDIDVEQIEGKLAEIKEDMARCTPKGAPTKNYRLHYAICFLWLRENI